MEVQALPPIITMEMHEIDKQKMDSLKALAEINMTISKTREQLSKIKAEESQYFTERERELLQKLANLTTDSQEIVELAYAKHQEVQLFCRDLINFSQAAGSLIEDLEQAQDLFAEKDKEFKNTLKIEQDRIQGIKNELKAQKIQLENEKTGLIIREKELVKQETKAKDLIEELKRGISRLKEGRI